MDPAFPEDIRAERAKAASLIRPTSSKGGENIPDNGNHNNGNNSLR